MTTQIEYALMAGASYISTRPDENKFPIPVGWLEKVNKRQALPSGFEATYFTKGTDLVISFAGTYDKDLTGDIAADIGLGAGTGSIQLLQAADYYLQVKASAPAGTHITLTGHSLGGGLAALIGVFFGETAVTFDQAPFSQTALFQAQSLLDYLTAEKNGSGVSLYTPAQLSGLTNFITQQQANGGIPSASLVSTTRVDGEFLSELPIGAFSGIGTPAAILNHGPTSLAGTDLHSVALLTAFLQSQQTATTGKALNDVTFKLTDLLAMLFDDKLFAHRTDTGIENLLERLVKHEAGVRDTATGVTTLVADQMVDRFTSDLWKLAQDGGMTLKDGNSNSNWVSRALTAFAMQKYYEETQDSAGYKKELFTDLATEGGSGGIRFDMADVSKKFATALGRNGKLNLSDAKGFDLYLKYFFTYTLDVNDNFTAAEDQLILSQLPSMRDWYVQAGTGAMNASDALGFGSGAFMLGGVGNDSLTGGDKSDLLVGNAGADTLKGGKGNDTLIGGTGFDRHIENAGDGFDTVFDRDGSGVIQLGGIEAKGNSNLADATKWKQLGADTWVDTRNGIAYSKSLVNGETRLLVHKGDSNVLVKGWSEGELGIELGEGGTPTITPPATNLTLTGDLKPADTDPATAGIQEGYDDLGNLIVSGEAAPNREDTLYDSVGNDHILAGGGNDYVNAWRGGDDRIEGGAGQDLLNGGSGNDSILGGADSDGASGGDGNDQLYGETETTFDAAYALGETQAASGQRGDLLDGGTGDDTLIGEAGNDILLGGLGQDILMGLGGDDTIEGDANVVSADRSWDVTRTVTTTGDVVAYARNYSFYTANLDADIGDADVIYGGAGNDWLLAGGGNDFVDGGADTIRLARWLCAKPNQLRNHRLTRAYN